MKRQGQTIMEIIFLLGIVVLALYVMGPAIKRGMQSLVKASADQIGTQTNADQRVVRPSTAKPAQDWDSVNDNEGGYLVGSSSTASSTAENKRTDRLYVSNVEFHEQTNSTMNSVTDLGFTRE